MVKVLEVDQWTSTGKIAGLPAADYDFDKVEGGDSDAAKKIFGGHSVWKDVDEHAKPSIGNVWFKEDDDGLLQVWKTNYDSSD
jgi:hypothetical protein